MAVFFCDVGTALAAGTKIVYPASETPDDVRFNDLIEMLQVALDKTVPEFGPYELEPSRLRMNEARYLAQLKAGDKINVMWSSTSNEKERDFLTVRVPLRKGLLGYRIALIAKKNQGKIDQIKTLADLKAISVGQGVGWGDAKLYEENGIQVTQANYDSLFKMVTAGRFDIFPRGINEIYSEFNRYAPGNPELAIEKRLLIYYPWPYYFFFNKQDELLRKRVEAGLRKMKADGSFDAIFWKYNGKAIEQADLKNRRVIKIKNDMLPPETPLGDASLWFEPGEKN